MVRAAAALVLALTACTAPPAPVFGPASPSPAAPAGSLPPGVCPGGDPLAGVYHPDRLGVLVACRTARGRVLAVLFEADGDRHIWLAPDPAYAGLLNSDNHYRGVPALVLEIIPDCASRPADAGAAAACPPSGLPEPREGERIEVWGPWVRDYNHGWNEIHPVDGLREVP